MKLASILRISCDAQANNKMAKTWKLFALLTVFAVVLTGSCSSSASGRYLSSLDCRIVIPFRSSSLGVARILATLQYTDESIFDIHFNHRIPIGEVACKWFVEVIPVLMQVFSFDLRSYHKIVVVIFYFLISCLSYVKFLSSINSIVYGE